MKQPWDEGNRPELPAVARLAPESARRAIAAFAKAHGYTIVAEFYDAAVSGADPIAERPGFKAMLDRIARNGVRCIIVESPNRFARDLTVQLTGHDFLKSLGVSLIPATAPDFFTEDTSTAVLVRQVLGAIAQLNRGLGLRRLTANHPGSGLRMDEASDEASTAGGRVAGVTLAGRCGAT
jgi:DNA invertase Pin-like site-specific DNA recombinase